MLGEDILVRVILCVGTVEMICLGLGQRKELTFYAGGPLPCGEISGPEGRAGAIISFVLARYITCLGPGTREFTRLPTLE